MKAITIRPEWAWLILHAGKDLENRSWQTRHRGPLLIHASAKRADDHQRIREWARTELGILMPETVPMGGIVGCVEVVEMVTSPVDSPWWIGPVAWRLVKPRVLPFRPMKGRLQLWDCEIQNWR